MTYSWKVLAPVATLLGAAALWYGVRRVAATAEPNVPLGHAAGRLAACPESPNCISTTSQDDAHQMLPLALDGDSERSLARLRTIVSQLPGSRLAESQGNYLHFVVRSRWLGFIDDVEFLAVPEEGTIHFRSGSRTGYSDLGVNRARMEKISQAYLAQ